MKKPNNEAFLKVMSEMATIGIKMKQANAGKSHEIKMVELFLQRKELSDWQRTAGFMVRK